MIRKIQSSEYLKRYDNMNALERNVYLNRVGEWLQDGGRALLGKAEDFEARLQNVITVSSGWNDAECSAWEDGVVLLSALVGTGETWLPELLYAKSARRCIKKMFGCISELFNTRTTSHDEKVNDKPILGKDYIDKIKRDSSPLEFRKQIMAVPGGQKPREHQMTKQRESTDPDATAEMDAASVPMRPKHIDQYVHLLPKKTQERAVGVRELLRELDMAREKARLLMDSPVESPADIAVWSKKATQIDSKVRSIYDELDREWEKLVKSGRVVVDALGNAIVLNADTAEDTEGAEAKELTSEQKARRRELRKWLIDTRRGNGNAREARVKQWRENFKEFLALDGDVAFVDKRSVEAANHYGIELEMLKGGAAIPSQQKEAKEAEEK